MISGFSPVALMQLQDALGGGGSSTTIVIAGSTSRGGLAACWEPGSTCEHSVLTATTCETEKTSSARRCTSAAASHPGAFECGNQR